MVNPLKRIREKMSLLPEFQLAEHSCLKCGEKFDVASGTESRIPEAGDASICCYCGNLALFMEGGGLEPWPDGLTIPDDVRAAVRMVGQTILS